MVKKIGIIGLGNVGAAVASFLKKTTPLIARRTGLRIKIKGVCDAKGDKRRLAKKLSSPFFSDAQALISDPEIDIIVELIGGYEPARTYIVQALKKGKDVVTANKALLSTSGSVIFSLAKAKNKTVGFEASVCGAIPLIKSIAQGLVSCEVKRLYGILNGTTNYILYKMGKDHLDFSSALKETQQQGLAERNPRLDIEGVDTLHKLCILSYLCFGLWPAQKKIYHQGISHISLLDILYAQELGYRIKLLAIAKKEKESIDLRVHPTLLPQEHPLAQTSGAYNAVYLYTHPAGELLFYGQGAGGQSTASSVISDIVSIGLNQKNIVRREEKSALKATQSVRTRYYIRFMAVDKPGVLARVSKILASFNISIASVTQKVRNKGTFVPIVMITHEAREADVRKALEKIDALSVIKRPSQIIRIEDL